MSETKEQTGDLTLEILFTESNYILAFTEYADEDPTNFKNSMIYFGNFDDSENITFIFEEKLWNHCITGDKSSYVVISGNPTSVY